MTPEGVLSAATGSSFDSQLWEVFCHPFTAGELVAQSTLGALRVNGAAARAEVVDRLGDGRGDYIVRITLVGELVGGLEFELGHGRRLELVA